MTRKMNGRDVVLLLAGLYALVSPLWTTTTTRATWTMVVLGAVAALAALAMMLRPHTMLLDRAMEAMGLLFIISPWVMRFSGTHPMAWTAWIVGAVTFIVAVGDFAWDSEHRGHGGHIAHTH